MSEEVSAPVSAPVATESAPVSSGSADSGGSTASSGQTSIHPEQNAAPQESVDWDSWDGVVDSLPESMRGHASQIDRWHRRDSSAKRQEIDDLKAVYTAMLNDEEDPRLGQLTRDLDEAKKSLDGRNTEFEGLRAQFDQMSELAVRDYVEQFWNHHAELREDEEKLSRFGPFLQEQNNLGGSWDGYVAAKLIELPEDAIEIAVDAKKNGVADAYALKLAEAHTQLLEKEEIHQAAQDEVAKEVKKEASKPRPAAKITSGASRSTRPSAANRGMKEAKTLDEMRNLAAKRALRVHSGGKK